MTASKITRPFSAVASLGSPFTPLNEDALKAVVRHVLSDIKNKVQQMVHMDINCPRKVHMVGLEAIGDQG